MWGLNGGLRLYSGHEVVAIPPLDVHVADACTNKLQDGVFKPMFLHLKALAIGAIQVDFRASSC